MECFGCENAVYIGEGDWFCDVAEALVITEHSVPTEHYRISCQERDVTNDT